MGEEGKAKAKGEGHDSSYPTRQSPLSDRRYTSRQERPRTLRRKMGRLWRKWNGLRPAAYCSQPSSLRSHNTVRLLQDGEEAYPAMLEAIAEAKRYIFVEFYRFRSDKMGWTFARALATKATQGVLTLIICDGFGALSASSNYWSFLKENGVGVVFYAPFRAKIRYLGALNRRDHRKFMVADGKVGFCGGINIGDEFASIPMGGAAWRDTAIAIRGPAVFDLVGSFCHVWRRAGGYWPLPVELFPRLPKEPQGDQAPPPMTTFDCRVAVVGTSKLRATRGERKAYLQAINAAKGRIFITHSYFVPPGSVTRALRRAKKRNVEVVLITAGTTDLPLVRFACHYQFKRLMQAGIKIYQWNGSVLHAKTAVVDGFWSTIGSFNLDSRSILHNLELNVVILDAQVGKQMEDLFRQDLTHCRAVDPTTWGRRHFWVKIAEWLCYRIRSWL